MAPYNYNNFYDPVGSQSNQPPAGYTYSNNNTSSTGGQYSSQSTANYTTDHHPSYATAYASQQYVTSGQQRASQTTSSTHRAASALNPLSAQTQNEDYTQSTSASRPSEIQPQYDNSNYYSSPAFAQLPNRTESNNSPLYATNTPGSTFGRLNLPAQSQTSSNTFGDTQTYQSTPSSGSRGYRNAPSTASSHRQHASAYTQAQSQPPQRYASPLHAVQAQAQAQHYQQGHTKQPSRSSNHQSSPQMSGQTVEQQDQSQQQRHQSASVEPPPTTVDPSQVYDFRAEQQRKAQIEAVRRKKIEEEQAARKAEEAARAAEAATQKAEEERVERQQQQAEETTRIAEEEAAKRKAAQAHKTELRRKAREEQKQSKTAATALTQMASGAGAGTDADMAPGMAAMTAMMGDQSRPPANNEEAEMRAMFQKMREFNARNPAMLAKLWEEERKAHAEQPPAPTQPVKSTSKLQQKAVKAASAAPTAPQQQTQPSRSFTQTANVIASSSAAPSKASPSSAPVSAPLWPPHKKGSLAEAAAAWLANLPQNIGSPYQIGKPDILKILDTNPSYVQLCESIEKTGVKFERSALAKELLKAVPDGLRNQQFGPKTPHPNAPVTGTASVSGAGAATNSGKKKPGGSKNDAPWGNFGTPQEIRRHQSAPGSHYQTPVFTSLVDAAREINSMSTAPAFPPTTIAGAMIGGASIESPYFADRPISNGKSRSASAAPTTAEVQAEAGKQQQAPPEEPPRLPANKEEAARKRNFTELVDLTKEDDSGDEGPPRKNFQPPAGPVNSVQKSAQNATFKQPMSFQQFMHQRQGGVANIMPGRGGLHPSAPPKYPWMSNSQASPLPAPPVVQPQAKPKGPTEEQKQYDRMRGKMLVEPIMRDRVARKSKYDSRTIARDVLLATGRHPDMRALNSHLNTMQKLLGDHGGVVDGTGNKSDLATIRWDIIDPGEPEESAKAKAKQAAETRGEEGGTGDADTSGADDDADDEGERPSEDVLRQSRIDADAEKWKAIGDPDLRKKLQHRLHQRRYREKKPVAEKEVRRRRRRRRRDENGELVDRSDQDEEASGTDRKQASAGSSGPKRRGRPPNKNRDSNASSAGQTPIRSTSAAGSPAPPDTMSSTGTPGGYAQFRQLDENGNPIKLNGRPVGWRKAVHSRAAQGLTPNKYASAPKGTPSRLRQSQGSESSAMVQPHWQVFKCSWRTCAAELDNLDRLKKHVIKVHGGKNADNEYECLWIRCELAGKHVTATGTIQDGDEGVATFELIDEWMKHVSSQHLEEVAWKLGDGPKGGSLTEYHTDSDAYLSDAYGRSVTPIIVPLAEQNSLQHNATINTTPVVAGSRSVATSSQATPLLISDLPTHPAMAPMKRIGRAAKNSDARGMAATKATSREEREAAAELKKLEDQKRLEGVSMGLEGTRLVNAKRRRGFLDDEDFEDVVVEEDF